MTAHINLSSKHRHNLGMSVLAADGSGFRLKARDELKISSS